MQARLGFICGMPRSGTTWLGRALAAHPEIAVFGETDFWGRDYLQPDQDGNYRPTHIRRLLRIQRAKDWQTTTGDDASLPDIPTGEYGALVAKALTPHIETLQGGRPEVLFSAIVSQIASRTGKPIIVEKTPGHLLFLDRIREAYPEAPIVILKREPLGFAASLTYRPAAGVIAGRPCVRSFAYHPAIVTYLWRGYARSLLAQLADRDSRVLVVDHAMLNQDTKGVAQAVARHLGAGTARLEVNPRPVNSSFASRPGREAPAATTFWLRRLALQECTRLYPALELPRRGWFTALASCLALSPALLLFLILYRPRSVALWTYARGFAAAGTNRGPRTRSSRSS